MKRAGRQGAVVSLLALGMITCCFLYPRSPAFNRGIPPEPWNFADDRLAEQMLVALAGILSLAPMTRRWIAGLLDKCRAPSTRARRWIAAAIFVLSPALLYALAVVRGRVLLPYWHDENFYRLQTTFLAHGKLVMPGLALPDFFDVPYVFVRPVYAVAYFPGTALLHVPAAWMHLPYFITPLLIAGVILALLYLITTEIVDGAAGLLAVVLMISLVVFRWMALIEMSHVAGAMWGLVVIHSWLAWGKTRKMRWVALAALAAGWYAVTRPLDCCAILSPVAIAWAWELRKSAWRKRGIALAVAGLMMVPLIALQLSFDRAVTGHLFQSPMGLYYRTYMNLRGIGLEREDRRFVPPTESGVIRDTYAAVVAPRVRDFTTIQSAARQWFNHRLPVLFGSSLPSLLLIVFIPVAMMGLRDRRALVIALAVCSYAVLSGFVFQFLDHYVMAVAALVVILVLIGVQTLSRAFPFGRLAEVFLPLALVFLAVHRLCLNDQGAYQRLGPGMMKTTYLDIPREVTEPAIVLFRYAHAWSSAPFDEEPVYNWSVISPDDAPIIRAHDLGPQRDAELFNYYAKRQPDRNVYLFDRQTNEFRWLGKAKDLAARKAAAAQR